MGLLYDNFVGKSTDIIDKLPIEKNEIYDARQYNQSIILPENISFEKYMVEDDGIKIATHVRGDVYQKKMLMPKEVFIEAYKRYILEESNNYG